MLYSFKDVVIDSRTGLNPRKNFILGNGDNYYITIKDIFNGKVNFSEKSDKIDDAAIQIIKRRSRIKVGDVLFVSIGRIGETAIVTSKDDSWEVNESVFIFTLNENIITPEYFCSMFQSKDIKQYLSGNSSGSTFKSIKMNQLERMSFDLPPIETQKNITTKLAAVKRIIDLRTSQLTELDNLIKSRFVELFGDTVLNPFGWEKDLLGTVCDVRDGTHDSPQYYETGYPLVTSKNVTGGKIDLTDCSLICEADFKKINERSKVNMGDIIMPMIGTVGKPVIVDIEPNFAIKNVSLIKFKANSRVLNIYIRALLQSDYFDDAVLSKVRGGTQKFIPLSDIRKLEVLVPPIELQEQFASFVEQTDKSKFVIQKSLDEMRVLYDKLMQEYFG